MTRKLIKKPWHTHNGWTWRRFSRRVRGGEGDLLQELDKFEDPILVTGCQRSGTTLMANIVMASDAIVDYRDHMDSELKGAVILCGQYEDFRREGRYCFQTTYINERYKEYFRKRNRFQMVYLVRNPYSVVWSMCYHWKRRSEVRNFALNELFESCGKEYMTRKERMRYKFLGPFGMPKIRMACYSYVSKTRQLFELVEKLGKDIVVVEYDDVITSKELLLPKIWGFLGLEYDAELCELIHGRGLKRAHRLTYQQRKAVHQICWDTYERAKGLASVATERGP